LHDANTSDYLAVFISIDLPIKQAGYIPTREWCYFRLQWHLQTLITARIY